MVEKKSNILVPHSVKWTTSGFCPFDLIVQRAASLGWKLIIPREDRHRAMWWALLQELKNQQELSEKCLRNVKPSHRLWARKMLRFPLDASDIPRFVALYQKQCAWWRRMAYNRSLVVSVEKNRLPYLQPPFQASDIEQYIASCKRLKWSVRYWQLRRLQAHLLSWLQRALRGFV